MRTIIAALALGTLIAVALYGAPFMTGASNCATLIFENNSPDDLFLFIDSEPGYRCSVFVQYGDCSTYVTAGEHKIEARYADGKVAVTDTHTFECGEELTWTVSDE